MMDNIDELIERLTTGGESEEELLYLCTKVAPEALKTLRRQLEEKEAEIERPDFRQMREMLRAMQAGELTVSRGIEILEMWWAGNWNDDMLPPVRQDLIEEDSMPVEIIDRLKEQLAAAQEEIESNKAYFTTLLEEQRVLLAKAEQLWQVAQGRCDGLEEKLAKAEQRVAEWQPIETAPKDGTRVLLCIDHGEWGDKVWTGLWGDGWMVSYGKARTEPTHWMPLPKAPANGASS